MTKRSNDATCYLRQVKRLLVCPMRYRRELMCRFCADIDAFSKRAPLVEYEHYVEQFGDPQTAADGLLCSLPLSSLRRSMNAVPFCIVIMTVLATLLTVGYIAVDRYIDSIPLTAYDFHHEFIDGEWKIVKGEKEFKWPPDYDWEYHSENAQ